ncbi:MAG: hypothetical protein ABGX33_04335 [Cycloclasticus sp.]
MSVGLLIILCELVVLLIAGGVFLFIKAQKSKEAKRSQLSGLLRKVANEAPDRVEKLAGTFKSLGVPEMQAEQSASQLVDAESACVKKFVNIELAQVEEDVAFFHEAIYELSAVHMGVSMLNAESLPKSQAPAEAPATVSEEPSVEIDEDESSVLGDDDIEVSLDMDDIDEMVGSASDEPEPEPEPEPVAEPVKAPENDALSFDIDDMVASAFEDDESDSAPSSSDDAEDTDSKK